jgi:hypothetical protein
MTRDATTLTDPANERLIQGRMKRSLAFGVALVLAPGCGGESVTQVTGDDDGASGSGGARCRVYASRFTQDGQDEASTCTFDRAAVTLTCKTQRFDLETTRWPTLDAFLANNRPVGDFTFDERRFVNEGECDYTQTVTRDDAGRPQLHAAIPRSMADYGCGDDTFTYLRWDAEGRPKAAMLSEVSSIGLPPDLPCTEQGVTYDYDDANRRYVEHRRGGNGLSCTDYSTTWTFDSDRLLVSEAYDFADGPLNVRSYSTLETERVCRD